MNYLVTGRGLCLLLFIIILLGLPSPLCGLILRTGVTAMFPRDDVYGFRTGTDRLSAGGVMDFGGVWFAGVVVAEALFELFLGVGVWGFGCQLPSRIDLEWRGKISLPRFPAS